MRLTRKLAKPLAAIQWANAKPLARQPLLHAFFQGMKELFTPADHEPPHKKSALLRARAFGSGAAPNGKAMRHVERVPVHAELMQERRGASLPVQAELTTERSDLPESGTIGLRSLTDLVERTLAQSNLNEQGRRGLGRLLLHMMFSRAERL
ncbi:unnamed protein product [Parajaminaea phylloscopi]